MRLQQVLPVGNDSICACWPHSHSIIKTIMWAGQPERFFRPVIHF